MKHRMASLGAAAAFLFCAGACAADEGTLSERVARRDGWVAWQVPMVDGAGVPCCLDWHQHRGATAGCDLDGRNWSFGTNDDDPRPATGGNLDVYVHVTHATVDKVRAFASTCTLRNAGQVRRLDGVGAPESVALLSGVAGESRGHDDDAALAALALHADGAADAALQRLADASHARRLREQALFWMAQTRGADAARFVERVATGDADPELRANAVFDLSQARGVDAYASIHRIAQHDASDHVREQALFWMAQMGDRRAHDDIVAAIATDASSHVREQGVFALSQLKGGESDAALIALVRGNYPREVKQQALFWLAQSGSDAAIQFLDSVLSRRAAKAAQD